MARQLLVEIDVSVPTTSSQLHQLLAASLGFPEWYGQNWDAFAESIAELVDMPITLRLVGYDALARRLPRDASVFREILETALREQPGSASAIVLT